MATVKQARRNALIQLLMLIVAVIVIVGAVVVYQNWANNRPGALPEDVSISASNAATGESVEVFPYLSCEPGTDCPEGEVPHLTVGPDDTLVLELPRDVVNKQWQLLTIYDDPAANDEQLHGPNETDRVEIPGSVDPIEASTGKRPLLQVVEVSAVMIGRDANGEEAPFTTVWSLSTMPT